MCDASHFERSNLHRGKFRLMPACACELSSKGDTAIGYSVEDGGQDSPGRGVTAFEMLALAA